MKAASLNEIRKHLAALDSATLEQLCTTLARYKKENKELLSYLLFEANDEQAYIANVKLEVDTLFGDLPKGNVYFVKKSIRKILRFINKQVRYSGIPGTDLEIRIYFCLKMKAAGISLQAGTVLYNLYQQQLKKIQSILSKLPEDLQFDYERDLRTIDPISKFKV
jgi:hypothetical protein